MYIKMTSLIRLTHWVIIRMNHPRIRVLPTHFQKISKISKIELPRNWTGMLISPESACFIELVLIFWKKKLLTEKKLSWFLIREFNLIINYTVLFFGHLCIASSLLFVSYEELIQMKFIFKGKVENVKENIIILI